VLNACVCLCAYVFGYVCVCVCVCVLACVSLLDCEAGSRILGWSEGVCTSLVCASLLGHEDFACGWIWRLTEPPPPVHGVAYVLRLEGGMEDIVCSLSVSACYDLLLPLLAMCCQWVVFNSRRARRVRRRARRRRRMTTPPPRAPPPLWTRAS
jgi:hypothetical protein